MKKYILPISALLFWTGNLFSQNIIRCSTEDYMSQEAALHPEQIQERAAVDLQADQFVQAHPNGITGRTVLTVPVVFHIVYSNSAQNISTQRINEQIQVLNEDYSKTNADASLVPSAFQSLAAACDIQFCLAQRDPNGNWTDGIQRVSTTVTSWSQNDNVKFTSSGGADYWDNTKYLNIWVCNLTQPSGILAYSTFPGVGPANKDGIVVSYKYVGKTGAVAPFNKGR